MLYAELACCTNKAEADKIMFDGNKFKFNLNNIYHWFRVQGGKNKSPREKPMITPEIKAEQKELCEDTKNLIAEHGDHFYACFLDKKCFYTIFCCRTLKVRPPRPVESVKEVAPLIPATKSHRFPTKVRILLLICYLFAT